MSIFVETLDKKKVKLHIKNIKNISHRILFQNNLKLKLFAY